MCPFTLDIPYHYYNILNTEAITVSPAQNETQRRRRSQIRRHYISFVVVLCQMFFNPNGIGVKCSLIGLGGGGQINHVSVWPPIWSELIYFILNWNSRLLSWLRQYKTGIFVSLNQCYYCANTGSVSKFCVACSICTPAPTPQYF